MTKCEGAVALYYLNAACCMRRLRLIIHTSTMPHDQIGPTGDSDPQSVFLLLTAGACSSLVSIFIKHAYCCIMSSQLLCRSVYFQVNHATSNGVDVRQNLLPDSSGPKGQCQGRSPRKGKARAGKAGVVSTCLTGQISTLLMLLPCRPKKRY